MGPGGYLAQKTVITSVHVHLLKRDQGEETWGDHQESQCCGQGCPVCGCLGDGVGRKSPVLRARQGERALGLPLSQGLRQTSGESSYLGSSLYLLFATANSLPASLSERGPNSGPGQQPQHLLLVLIRTTILDLPSAIGYTAYNDASLPSAIAEKQVHFL